MAVNLWVNIAYSKQGDGKIACTLTSNVPFERGVDYFDMKVYASDLGRVYDQFTVSPGSTIHIDVYGNDGEGSGISADFRATDQAVEVVGGGYIDATVSQDEPTMRECPYCHNLHEPHLIPLCPRKPKQDATEYNRRMDERNRIIRESVEKPWLPLHDGE